MLSRGRGLEQFTDQRLQDAGNVRHRLSRTITESHCGSLLESGEEKSQLDAVEPYSRR